jgi:hypothetical protein
MRTGVAAFAALFIIGCRERIVVTSQQGPVERISGATVVAGEPTLRLDHGPKEKPRAVFLVDGLRAEDLEALAGADEQALRQMFVLRVAEGPEDLPNLLGHYEVKDGSIRFEPRFPLQPGLRYRATFDPTRLHRPPRPRELGLTTFIHLAMSFLRTNSSSMSIFQRPCHGANRIDIYNS